MTTDSPILVVGAGPTGLTIACELLARGVGCRIVEAASAGVEKGSRAIGVSARSLEVFDDFGAATPLVEQGVQSIGAVFYSHRSPVGHVTAASVHHTRFPYMLTVPQPETERVLEQRLRHLGGTVERQVTLTQLAQEPGDHHVSVVLSHADGSDEPATASWVVGADGAHSAVRKLTGIEFTGGPARDAFVIVDVLADGGPPPGEGHYYFHPDGMSLVAPLPDGSYRLAATVRSKDEFADPKAGLQRVQSIYRQRIGPEIQIRGLRDAGWGVATTHVRTRMAGRYRAGRCLIAGDAAHLYGPVGGQGMNGGIQDAQNLAWKLALVHLGFAGEALLDTYEAERLPAARVALAAADEQTRVGTLRPWLGRAVRDALLRVGTKSGKLAQRVVPSLTQLEGVYPGNPYFGTASEAVGAGRRIPDTPVRGVPNVNTLYDILRRNWFTIVILGTDENDQPALARLAGDRAESIAQVIVLHRDTAAGAPPAPVPAIDDRNSLHDALQVRGPSAYLVRPDQYIGVSCGLADIAPVASALSRVGAAGLPAPAQQDV
jgi:2-polyprenyl-6-methoxyphenol hydroxylase-like FAD-dependent oxidoreductase